MSLSRPGAVDHGAAVWADWNSSVGIHAAYRTTSAP